MTRSSATAVEHLSDLFTDYVSGADELRKPSEDLRLLFFRFALVFTRRVRGSNCFGFCVQLGCFCKQFVSSRLVGLRAAGAAGLTFENRSDLFTELFLTPSSVTDLARQFGFLCFRCIFVLHLVQCSKLSASTLSFDPQFLESPFTFGRTRRDGRSHGLNRHSRHRFGSRRRGVATANEKKGNDFAHARERST